MDNDQRKTSNCVMRERLWDIRAMANRAGGFYGALEVDLDEENKKER